MDYQEIRPGVSLRRHVECFWFLSDRPPAGPRPIERIVPDGCTELIVHLGEPFERVTPRGLERQAAAFLVGQMSQFILLRPSRRIDTLGVRFRPAGARRPCSRRWAATRRKRWWRPRRSGSCAARGA